MKESVSFDQVIDYLHLDLKQSGNAFRGSCPACNGDSKRNLVYTPGRGAYCFAEGKGGDQLWLASHIRGIGVKDAAEELAEHFGVSDSDERPAKAVKPSHAPEPAPTGRAGQEGPDTTASPFQPLSYLEHDHDLVQDIGFDPNQAEQLGVGWAGKGMMRQRVCIPLRLPDGTLTGYLGIALDADPPLKLPSTLRL